MRYYAITYWLLCILAGRVVVQIPWFTPGTLLAMGLGFIALIVIAPCAFAPFFIDPRYNKDTHR